MCVHVKFLQKHVLHGLLALPASGRRARGGNSTYLCAQACLIPASRSRPPHCPHLLRQHFLLVSHPPHITEGQMQPMMHSTEYWTLSHNPQFSHTQQREHFPVSVWHTHSHPTHSPTTCCMTFLNLQRGKHWKIRG